METQEQFIERMKDEEHPYGLQITADHIMMLKDLNRLPSERELNTYTLVEWPESQEYMDEEWFGEEAVLDTDCTASLSGSSYFIPTRRLKEFEDKDDDILETDEDDENEIEFE